MRYFIYGRNDELLSWCEANSYEDAARIFSRTIDIEMCRIEGEEDDF